MEDSRYKLDFKKNLAPDFALTYDTCSAKKFTLFSAIMSNTFLLPYEYRHVREDYPVTAVLNMDRKRAQCIQTRSAILFPVIGPTTHIQASGKESICNKCKGFLKNNNRFMYYY